MFRILYLLFFACWLLPSAANAQTDWTHLFVFGDSLSDNGNAAAARDQLLGWPFFPTNTVGLCNPADIFVLARDCEDLFFRKSRVTDGPVAVEQLAARLGLALAPSLHLVAVRLAVGQNYAVASAKARGSRPHDLAPQVDALLLDHGSALPSQGLYVVMIGGNDAIDALQALAVLPGGSPSAESSREIVAAAVAAISDQVERLIASGARYVLVANAPNIGALPAVRSGAAETGVPSFLVAAVATGLTLTFNARLSYRLAEIRARQPSAEIGEFDTFRFFELERARARLSGQNVRDACFDSRTYFDSPTAERTFHEDCAPQEGASPRFDGFVFWDEIHPTSHVHAAAGDALFGAAQALAAGD